MMAVNIPVKVFFHRITDLFPGITYFKYIFNKCIISSLPNVIADK